MKPDENFFKEYLGSLTEDEKHKLFKVSLKDLQDYYSSISCKWAVRIISRVASLTIDNQNDEWEVFACWDCKRTFLDFKKYEKHIQDDFLPSKPLPNSLLPNSIELQWFTMLKFPKLWKPLDHPSAESSTKTNLLERRRLLQTLFEQLRGLSDDSFLCQDTCVRMLNFCRQYIPAELVSGPKSLCYLPLQQLELVISFLEFLGHCSTRRGGGKVIKPLEKKVDSESKLVLRDGLVHLIYDWTISDEKKLKLLYNPSVNKEFSEWEPDEKNSLQNSLVDQEFIDWEPKLQNIGMQFLEKFPETYKRALQLCERKDNILKYMEVLESVIRKCVVYSNSKELRKRSLRFLLHQQIKEVPKGNGDAKIFLQVLNNILKEQPQPPDPPTQPKNVSHLFVSEAYRSLHTLEFGEEAHHSYSHLRGAMLKEYLTKDLQVMELDLAIYQVLSKHLFYLKNLSNFSVVSYNYIIGAMIKRYIRNKLEQVFQTTKAAKKTRKQKMKEEQAGNKKDVVIKHNVVQSVLVSFAEDEMTREEEMLSQGMTRISLNNKRSKGKKH